jgi:hypothetical protein
MHWLVTTIRTKGTKGADYLGVFLLVAVIYGIVNASSTFLDPDSFYHVKMTELLMQRGIIRDFNWLPYTTLAHAFADHHFLYHVILVPFVSFYGSFIGAKIATVFLAAGALTAFYAALKEYDCKLPFAFTMLLATSSSFMFRMNLTKTSAISVMVLMLALIAIRRGSLRGLFFLSWAYVLLYGGWPIFGVVIGAFLLARAVVDRLLDRHPLHSWGNLWFWRRLFAFRRNAVADFMASKEVRLAFAVAAGLTCGIVINPYFPVNLRFYWEQIVQIAVLNYSDKIGVGAEWYPYTFPAFYTENSIVFICIALCIALLLMMIFWDDVSRWRATKVNRQAFSARVAVSILSIFFLLMTIRSRRHVEYFVPFTMFAVALFYTSLATRMDWSALSRRLQSLLPAALKKEIALGELACVYLTVMFVFLCARNVLGTHDTYAGGIPWTRFAKVAEWTRSNIPAGAIIVHSDWDEFPPLFYHDDTHRYICGLDPTFLYRQDPTRYWLWVNVSTGKAGDGVGEKVRDGLGSRYLLVDSKHTEMRKELERDPSIERIYSDDEASVYAVR